MSSEAARGGTGGGLPSAGTPLPRGPGAEGASILALVAVSLLANVLWRYRGGVGESDVMAMAAGLARGMRSGTSMGGAMLYGRHFSPGIYLLFHGLQGLLGGVPARTLPLLNALGLIAGGLLPWPLYLLYRRTFRPAVAASGTLLTIFSPLVWESTIYFHPVVPATLLLLFTLLAYERIERSAIGATFAVLTLLLGLSAVLMRAEVLLAVPATLAMALISRRRRRNLLLIAGLLLATVLLTGAFLVLLSSGASEAGSGLVVYVRQYLERYMRPSIRPPSILWITLGVGTGTVLCVLAAALRPTLRRSGASTPSDGSRGAGSLTAAIVWTIVPLAFWLPNPVPRMRHYFLVAPGVVWILCRMMLRRLSARALGITVLILLAVNLGFPEAFYRVYNRTHPHSPKAPLGSFFSLREATVREIQGHHRLQARIDSLLSPARPGGQGPAGPKVAIQAIWSEYAYLRYWIETNPERFLENSITTPAENVFLLDYTAGVSKLCLVYSGPLTWGPVREAVLAQLDRLRKDGYNLLITTQLSRDLASEDPRIRGTLSY